MKKTLAVLTLLAGAVSGYSQGQVAYGDYLNSDFQITIWSPQTGAASATQLNGNSPATFGTGLLPTGPDIPTGTQTGYTGVPLGGSPTGTGGTSPANFADGNLWSVQLYAAPTGTALAAVAGTVANMYTASGNQGLYDVTGNPVATIPGVTAGGSADLQLKAWYNGGGVNGSYEAALAAKAPNGVSTIGTENLGGGTVTPPDLPGPGNKGVTGGITSFNVTSSAVTPEPSTIALGIIGASAFLMRLRRK